MRCPQCGKELPLSVNKCPQCGTEVKGEAISSNIRRCPDGVYRWVYEYNLWKRSTILWEIIRFLLIVDLVQLVILLIVDIPGIGLLGALKRELPEAGILFAIMSVLAVLAYGVYALLNNGKYLVLFEMGEESIMHTRMAKTVKKPELVEWLWAANEILESRVLSTTLSIKTASTASMDSLYSEVRSFKALDRQHTILLKCELTSNQIYAYPEDYEFVKDYIYQHCGRINGQQDK